MKLHCFAHDLQENVNWLGNKMYKNPFITTNTRIYSPQTCKFTDFSLGLSGLLLPL